jgi:steroid 5-alpha reductase family enzyme
LILIILLPKEIFADVQKAKWVKQGRNGGFCTVGVWKYSRHPNYFGEIFQWWCIWLFSYGSSTGVNDIQWWCSILSPIMTMEILLNTPATGVMNANGKNLKRYYDNYAEEYAVYRNKTSILIPLPFGIYEFVPIALKRTIFFDFKCYEYIPGGDDEETKKSK